MIDEFLIKLALIILTWLPEIAVAYLIWNTPIWFAGAILSIVFEIVYGITAVFISFWIASA